ncbi:MAG: type II toxin-antitoxin system VapC family toxin [Thermodesulfobacteriota bacterium]
MKLVDLNLLVYAINVDAPVHDRARSWWEDSLSRPERVGLSWAVILGFLRLTTSPRVMPRPLAASQAVELIDDWLRQPMVRIVVPTKRHWSVLRQILGHLGTAGNLTTDAHLAALAIEHNAILCSTDQDFARFPLVRWTNPLQDVPTQ